ncbi:hypothetical protein DMA11_01830 [Marinilabiliaceae bacterium JC017]|nr:hypothetical protein DMA11_01830 [Marinilabiliaceae bacterium JC017]
MLYTYNPNSECSLGKLNGENWCSFGSSVRLAPRLEKNTKKPEVQEIPLVPFPTNNKKVFHFHPVAFVEQMQRVHKAYKDISLADIVTFYGYRPNDSNGCYRRCVDMLNSCGYTTTPPHYSSVIQMTKYKSNDNQVLVIQNEIEKGVKLIHDHLDKSIPILVGTDWKLGHTGNFDKTTDH